MVYGCEVLKIKKMKPKLTKDLVEFSRKQLISGKEIIFHISIVASLFLLFIYLNSTILKLNYILIGVFQELLTIPCILIQPVLLFLSLRRFIKIKFKVKSYTFYTLILSLMTMILTWGSLIIN